MNERTTLILDGIWGRPERFGRMRQWLEARCGPTEVFRYDCSGFGCLEREGEKLAAMIRSRAEPVNVVGFSMGGLVVRAAHQTDPSLPIRRAAFLNSPHAGTWLAYLAPFKALRGIRQMRPASEFLKRLASVNWEIPTLAVWSPLDLVVVPGRSARWAGVTVQMRCDVPAHVWPICSRAVHARIAEFFAAHAVV